MKKFILNRHVPVETEGNFTLEVNQPIYKIIEAGPGRLVRNKVTREIVGKYKYLHVRLHNMRTLAPLLEPDYEEDVYEIVEE
jgi:hypothetical protein